MEWLEATLAMVTDTEALYDLTQTQYNPPWINFVCSVSGLMKRIPLHSTNGVVTNEHIWPQCLLIISDILRNSFSSCPSFYFILFKKNLLLYEHCDNMPSASIELGCGRSLGLTGCRQHKLAVWHTVSMQQTVRLQHWLSLKSYPDCWIKEQNIINLFLSIVILLVLL